MSERRTDVDPDAEREVDLRSAWSRLAARWWLPVGGLVVGAILGVLVSVGSAQVYKAETLLYLGQPFTPGGGGQSPRAPGADAAAAKFADHAPYSLTKAVLPVRAFVA